MGAHSSKVRTLPKQVSTTQATTIQASKTPIRPSEPIDDRNPNLIANLARLGPVKVNNPNPSSLRTPPSQSQSGDTDGRVTTQALVSLLQTIHRAPTPAHAKQLVQNSKLDYSSFEKLRGRINIPSQGRPVVLRRANEQGETLFVAEWR